MPQSTPLCIRRVPTVVTSCLVKLSVLAAKIARVDWPRNWSELFPSLVYSLVTDGGLRRRRALRSTNEVLYYVPVCCNRISAFPLALTPPGGKYRTEIQACFKHSRLSRERWHYLCSWIKSPLIDRYPPDIFNGILFVVSSAVVVEMFKYVGNVKTICTPVKSILSDFRVCFMVVAPH